MTDAPVYDTISAAEKAITDAGYVRDNQRHVWVHPGTRKTARVVSANNFKFSVEWS